MMTNEELIAELRSEAETNWAPTRKLMQKSADALEAAQAENARLREESYTHQGDALMMTGERDAALARLAELSKQEPIGCGYVVRWERGDTPSTHQTGYAQVVGVAVYAAAAEIGKATP